MSADAADPRLTPYGPGVSRLRSAVELASDVAGLRLVLATTLGDRYRVRVRDDGAVVGLWRRCGSCHPRENLRSGRQRGAAHTMAAWTAPSHWRTRPAE